MVDRRSRARKKTDFELGRPPARRGTLRLFMLLGVLVLVNLYVFLWRDGTSISDVRARAADIGHDSLDPTAPPPGGAAPDAGVTAPLDAGPFTGEVVKNDSLGKILRNKAKLSASAADELIRAVQPIFDLRSLQIGQAYTLVVGDDGRVESFQLVVSRTVTIEVVRDPDTDELVGKKDEAATRVEVHELGGRIDSSLYASIKAADEDTALVAFFVDVFAYDVDFYNDTFEGDTFRVIVEKEYKDQEFLRYRRILAAEYAGKVGTFRAFWWQPSAGSKGQPPGRYYDEKGESVEKTMLKTPLKFAHVSSGFNPKRMHPVLHRVRGHFGTDFAAPVGTPVWAAADGVISQRGWAGGGGNQITLRHDNGLATIYMHLSKFAGGQKVGQRVTAKTVIGYVGSTGLSTGPHLHFGVKQNGSWVDFQKLRPTKSRGVSRADMPAFKAAVGGLVERLAAIPTAPAAPGAPGAGDAPGVAAAP